jgi:uncharacterized sulfatase
MDRRRFLKFAAGAGAAGMLWRGGAALGAADSKRPPNVVLIISDDHHWSDYGFMGGDVVKTPRLDSLAGGGLVLRRSYVPTALCRPSLATLSTGLYPHQHRITGNDAGRSIDNGREESIKLHDGLPALPRMLAGAGYNCLQTGKWWEGSWKRAGFTHGMTQGTRHGDAGLKIGRDTMQPIHDVIDESVKAGKPFFVWYAPFLPHQPHNPPQRLLDKYLAAGRPKALAAYYAMVEWLDETCGDLLGYLDAKGVADDTLVIFVADNGWTQGAERQGGYTAARGKLTVYEGGVRTPIVVRWPGRVKPAADDTHLASSIDIVPTILAACGLKTTADMQGVNLLDADALAKRERIFGEGFEHNMADLANPAKSLVARWCIEGRWKLIVHAEKGRGKVELYDVLADPYEKTDLAGSQPDKVKALRARIDEWWPAKA